MPAEEKNDLQSNLIEWTEVLMKIMSATFFAYTILVATYFIKSQINTEMVSFYENFYRLFTIVIFLPPTYLLLASKRFWDKTWAWSILIGLVVLILGTCMSLWSWLFFIQFQAAKNCEIWDFSKVKEEVCIVKNVNK